ncbi:MAG TPA: peptidyl-prolyl cis-trans isomerase [Phycisphaerales bacterium]|nr:peptidyl-prolyl cis-trans isomerase [Phycisphaerales bacterium]
MTRSGMTRSEKSLPARNAKVAVGSAAMILASAVVTSLPGCGGGSRSDAPRTNLAATDFTQTPEQNPEQTPAQTAEQAAAAPQNGTGGSPGDGGPAQASPPSSRRTAAEPVVRPGPYNITRTGPVAAREGIDVVTTPGVPVVNPAATAVESPVLIDAKVGDVNGRPIFISDFFQTMDARLKSEAKTARTFDDFAKVSSEAIIRKLQEIINDELLQAEARSQLTPEQKQGFRYWIQSLEADFVSRNYRSRTMAEQRLAEAQEAASLEEWKKKREERELVIFQLRSQVFKNVHVPFREIELYYNQRYDEFNPGVERQFRVISLPASTEEDNKTIQSVLAELQAGADFTQVASRPINLFRAKEGGLYIPPKQAAPAAKASEPPPPPNYFQIPAINEAALRLKGGEWTGPIPNGTSASFIKLEESQKPATSLYEAQYTIEQTLRSEKASHLTDKYIGDLLKRASVDNRELLAQRLFELSIERYWIPQRGAPQ